MISSPLLLFLCNILHRLEQEFHVLYMVMHFSLKSSRHKQLCRIFCNGAAVVQSAFGHTLLESSRKMVDCIIDKYQTLTNHTSRLVLWPCPTAPNFHPPLRTLIDLKMIEIE